MVLKEEHAFRGLQTDVSPVSEVITVLSNCRNIRITSPDNNQSFCVINEKSNSLVSITSETEENEDLTSLYVIGQACINDFLVWFGKKDEKDYIVRLHFLDTDNCEYKVLYKGDLGFSVDSNIDSICFYENESIIKVYWVDGINPYRGINIMADTSDYNDYSFDSTIGWLSRQDSITISHYNAPGLFTSGSIQYVFTYGKKYMQETSPFHISSYYYLSNSSTYGEAPNSSVYKSIKIEITPDTREEVVKFDYINVYSILKTSTNATPICKKVGYVELSSTESPLIFMDNGKIGESVDLTDIMYLGGSSFSATTLDQKDNTIFLGNFTLKDRLILKADDVFDSWKIAEKYVKVQSNFSEKGYYNYTVDLSLQSSDCKGFKYLEWYRFGVRVMFSNGVWSSPIYIDTVQCTLPRYENYQSIFTLKGTLKKELNVTAVQPLIVLPGTNRSIICQGVINPTVFNTEMRKSNSPFSQASWFFRPIVKRSDISNDKNLCSYFSEKIYGEGITVEPKNYDSKGAWGYGSLALEKKFNVTSLFYQYAEFRHLHLIPDAWYPNGEIQTQSTITYNSSIPLPAIYSEDVSNSYSLYGVDQSIVTLHSPDLAYSTLEFPRSTLKLRVVGIIPLDSFNSSQSITTETGPTTYEFDHGAYPLRGVEETDVKSSITDPLTGFPDSTDYTDYTINLHPIKSGGEIRITSNTYQDLGVQTRNSSRTTDEWREKSMDWIYSYMRIYPWHNSTCLGSGVLNSSVVTGKYSRKVLNNVRYSNQSIYLSPEYIQNHSLSEVNSVSAITSDQEEVLDLNGSSSIKYYQGNIKQVATQIENYILAMSTGLFKDKIDNTESKIEKYELYQKYCIADYPFLLDWGTSLNHEYVEEISGSSVCPIYYKSSPHVAVILNNKVLPKYTDKEGSYNVIGDDSLYNGISSDTYTQDSITIYDFLNNSYYNIEDAFLYIGELYRDIDKPYGGDEEQILRSHTWNIGGLQQTLESNEVNVSFTEGDTYYQRYDCLKTYSYSDTDQNSVLDTLSFMCETRVNLDAQYSILRNPYNATSLEPSSIIQVNDAYNVSNPSIEYTIAENSEYEVTKFSTSFTWSTTKIANSMYDQWLHITMANTMTARGDSGNITAIRLFNDTLLLFQERSTSQILYNERAQIPTSDGTDIEIGNSGKVSGIKPYFPHIGIQSFLHTAQSNNTLLLYDSVSKGLYTGNNSSVVNISREKLCQSWFNAAEIKKLEYNPILREFYIYGTKEVPEYIVFDESFNSFSSIMDCGDKNIFNASIKNSFYFTTEEGNVYKLHGGDDYGSYLGNQYESFIELLSSPSSDDKVFDNVEFELEGFDENNEYLYKHCFNSIESYNNYQYGKNELKYNSATPDNLKKKFKIWRAKIPRDSKNHIMGRIKDRIRNPWTFIKLTMNSENNIYKYVLRTLNVLYSQDTEKQNNTQRKE